MSLRPVIAICGTTGVGKSKLAIELALAMSKERRGGYTGARIINADAMQVYAGIDILTNKVPIEEQCGVEHLLMGFKHPGEQYVVGQWVKDATRLIEETHHRGQIPIVVGGTSYWIQHLIFPGRLAAFDADVAAATAPVSGLSPRLAQAADLLPSELLSLYHNLPAVATDVDAESALALHRLLTALDPAVAQRWHWKDTRKVLRSLELTKQTGHLPSDIIAKQSQVVLPPRYRTLCFWLYARPEVLNPRLDARVDQMLEQGLLREVEELMEATKQSPTPTPPYPGNDGDGNAGANTTTDYTLGIYQSIGYKEFSSYLSRDQSLPVAEHEKAFKAAVERMKVSTRQYAKRQVSWLRNKLLPAARDANKQSRELDAPGDVVPTFLLDASELGDRWVTDVQQMAGRIAEDFLERRPLPDPLDLGDAARELLVVPERSTECVEMWCE
ncbi:uncharacterized protein PHACADRAFT_161824 [Phanerochaete carnosa HHB-10118-sp]|uniref:tRNA dimethylallyltransferase n=1 Tax=Phanerochaete carnosa (strain HHB-10118-sp) TaxID=650164 RepID=K5V008_PHACS|nr:uncharacterized protein PHACADRAFT_161824 [Phanerochaete carnosa HHB-10118-sp]EKM55781.1 hypothetical protein PHACADRAFT_161824 [Phanerochaete carnosa HHB-10118-sp]